VSARSGSLTARSSVEGVFARLGDRLLAGILAGLTRWAETSSIERCVEFGARIGRAWVRLRLPRTRRVRSQLELAFPDASRETLDGWTDEVFVHLGRSLAELILLRGRHRSALVEQVEVQGLEHLDAAERESETGGVLFVSAHYGNWELAGIRLADLGLPISVVYRGISNSVLDRALLALRVGSESDPGDYEQIKLGRAGLALVRALRAGRKCLVLLDQNVRPAESDEFVPFFGRPASVRTGPVRLAQRLGVPVLVAFIRRDPGGLGHRIRIEPRSTIEVATGDAAPAARHVLERITAGIETQIREVPGQWIWTHRRWRSQPHEADAESS
jgi:KDO2-lipid IV(A) lauroyltransferase